jgi:hypothetical protein
MALTICYCAICDEILATAPTLGLTGSDVSHKLPDGTLHQGAKFLRLPDAVDDHTDFALLKAKYPKSQYAQLLEDV